MRKLGLCVRYDCDNFGSMLQIMATQKIIKELGWDYEIIKYDKRTLIFYLKNVTRIFNPYFMSGKIMDYSKKRQLKRYNDIQEKNDERKKLIQNYREKYIGPYSDTYKGYKKLTNEVKKYDAVMVGSDQLWTPAGIKSKFYNLLFVPENIRKISFATSFGVSRIPREQYRETKKYLSRIDYLSVREQQGIKIVNSLIGKKASLVLDPTLMYDQQMWEEIFTSKKLIDEPYIFAYFLGTNVEHRKAVEEFARKIGLKIVTCPHMDYFVEYDINFGDIQRFNTDPIDFLNLIRNAEYVCTDSFHGTVFSILNHKKFMTFDRYSKGIESRNSRIDSLFKELNLESRRSSGKDICSELIKSIDYKKVDCKLSALRKQSFEFLEKALR